MVEQCASDGAEARGYFEAVAHELMRLREALEIISRYDSGGNIPTAADALAYIARRALKDKP